MKHKSPSKASRVGWGISGVSLFVLIISLFTEKFYPLPPGDVGVVGILRILGIAFGGGGVLSGLIVVVADSNEGRPSDDRNPGISSILKTSGMVAIVLAGAAALGEHSWMIGGVAVSLSIFELWGRFWGSRGGAFLTFRAIVQLLLFVTFLFAALNHGH